MLLGKPLRTHECLCLCAFRLVTQIAVEADARLGYDVYPATAETHNLFQMVPVNRKKTKKHKTELKTNKKSHAEERTEPVPLCHAIKR